MRSLPALLLLATLGVACSDQATAPARQTPTLAANFMNNPDNGNARIWRGAYDYAAAWTDPSNGLRAFHRTTPVVGQGCGAFEPGGPMDWQEIVSEDPGDFLASRLIANATGDVWITIRDTGASGTCFGNQLIAEGWGTLRYNDNDEIAWYANDRNNNNPYGFVAHGNLTAPDGTKVRYNGRLHLTWDPDTWVFHSEFYRVNIN